MDTSNSLDKSKYILRKKNIHIFSHYMYNRLILFPTVLAYYLFIFVSLTNVVKLLTFMFFIFLGFVLLYIFYRSSKSEIIISGFFYCYNVFTLHQNHAHECKVWYSFFKFSSNILRQVSPCYLIVYFFSKHWIAIRDLEK